MLRPKQSEGSTLGGKPGVSPGATALAQPPRECWEKSTTYQQNLSVSHMAGTHMHQRIQREPERNRSGDSLKYVSIRRQGLTSAQAPSGSLGTLKTTPP